MSSSSTLGDAATSLCLLASAPLGNGMSRHLHSWVIAVLLVGNRRVPGRSLPEVCNHPWSSWCQWGNGSGGRFVRSPLLSWNAVHQMLSLVPCVVTVHGAPGHNRWGVAETPLPAKSQGRNMDCLFSSTCQSPVQGVVLSVSRRRGQSPRYREHAQGADAVSRGPQQARNTQGSERTATVGPYREPPRASDPRTGGRPSPKWPNDWQAAYFLTWPSSVLYSLRGCSESHRWPPVVLSVTSHCFTST